MASSLLAENASNVKGETIVKAEQGGNNEPTAGDQEEKKVQHRFSEPWEDSDLILVVENEKFHVHRLIMSMNSPVFKAMFKSQFKEATSNEIPLPEKKANELLDFLKHIYCQQIEEPVEITMENVEHLLKLSDEYEVKVLYNSCIKFLEDQRKTKENVMKVLTMADMYHLDNIRQGCCENLLNDMKLKTLSEVVRLEDLDRESMQLILTQRIERLEAFLNPLYPQLIGLVECVLWLMTKADDVDLRWPCAQHLSGDGKLMHNLNIDDEEIRNCQGCKRMLNSAVRATYKRSYGRTYYKYGSNDDPDYHFNEWLHDVIGDLRKLLVG